MCRRRITSPALESPLGRIAADSETDADNERNTTCYDQAGFEWASSGRVESLSLEDISLRP